MELRILKFTEFLHLSFIIYTVCCAPMVLFINRGPQAYLLSLLPVLYLAILELMQDKLRNLIPFTVVRIFLFGLFLMLQVFIHRLPGMDPVIVQNGTVMIVLRSVVCFLLTIYSFQRRIVGERGIYPDYLWIGYYIALYAFCNHFDGQDGMRLAVIFQILSLFNTMVYKNIASLDREFELVSGDKGVPYAPIRRTNVLMMLMFFSVSAAAGALTFTIKNGEAILNFFKNILFFILRCIILLLAKIFHEDVVEETTGEAAAPMGAIDLGPAAPSTFMEILGNIIVYCILIALAVLVLYLIYRAILELNRLFKIAESGKTRDKAVSLIQTSERVSLMPGVADIGKRMRSRFNPDPDVRVRRAYRKFLLSQCDRQVKEDEAAKAAALAAAEPASLLGANSAVVTGRQKRKAKTPSYTILSPSYTPAQLEQRVLGSRTESEAGRNLHALYERARYAPASLTGEEESAIKEAIKGLNTR